MAVKTPTIVEDSAQNTGRFSKHYQYTLAFGTTDTMSPISVDPRTSRVMMQVTPVGTGTGNIQGALTQSTPAAGDWVNWTGGSVSAVTQGQFTNGFIPKYIQALVTAGTVRVDIWLWG